MTLAEHPVELEKLPDRKLRIVWSDGVEQVVEIAKIRRSCLCANCRSAAEQTEDESPGLRVLSPAETMPLEIESMHPVGNYAYNIHFSDGHTTGIFTFQHLRRLSDN